ncbi:hypothetical protein [Bacteroides cellulosilyticus]|jgi:hypothetical protein|uniref:hypothetical protein n=1 Tax=Bacteroides cellulosilyticus TaxID=246787 RepID=UPI00189AD261|nr:hypothetical protein [Bacteroides cellulosilyticus]
MKLTFISIFVCLGIALPCWSQTYYKYLYTINSSGVKLSDSGANSYFNGSRTRYVTFYNNKQSVAFTWEDGNSSCYYIYEGRDNGIHVYTGLKYDGPEGYGAALYEMNILGDMQKQNIRLYFNSDYSRLNIKMMRSGKTHVLQKSADPEEIAAPDSFY